MITRKLSLRVTIGSSIMGLRLQGLRDKPVFFSGLHCTYTTAKYLTIQCSSLPTPAGCAAITFAYFYKPTLNPTLRYSSLSYVLFCYLRKCHITLTLYYIVLCYILLHYIKTLIVTIVPL